MSHARRRFTLRNKLILLMVSMLLITAAPLIFMSLYYSETSLKKSYSDTAESILKMAESIISEDLSEVITLKSLVVSSKKDLLQQAVASGSKMVQHRLAENSSITEIIALLDTLKAESTLLLLTDQGVPMPGTKVDVDSDFRDIVTRLSVQLDSKGRSLHFLAQELIHEKKNDFVVLQSQNKTNAPLLMFLQPLGNMLLAAVASLEDVDSFIHNQQRAQTLRLQDAFDEMALPENSFASAFASDTLQPIVIPNRPFSHDMYASLATAVKEKKGSVVLATPEGPLLCTLKFMPKYHTILFTAMPEQEITNALKVLAIVQGVFFSIILLVGMVLAVLLGKYMLSPLARLSHAATLFAEQDFSLPRPADEPSNLPVTRNDEIGDVARSFAAMGSQLHQNVTRLMHTTAVKERLESELDVARQIQEGILPKIFPAFPNLSQFSLYASLDPAKEMGGDLYDFFMIDDDHLCVAIGDVSGKGVPAALFMSITVTLIRAAMKPGIAPHNAMKSINNNLTQGNPHDMFVTLFLGLYNIHTGDLHFALGGHPPAVLMRPDHCRVLNEWQPDLVLGSIENINYAPQSIHLEYDDALFFYTDGLTESSSIHKDFYGEERLVDFLQENIHEPVDTVVTCVLNDVLAFTKTIPQFDDITLLMLKRSVLSNGDHKKGQNV